MSEYMETVKRWAGEGVAWAEALLVKAQHSSPLPPGARLAVNARGERIGAISMGCVESDLIEHLQTVLKDGTPRLLHYGTSTSMVFEVGLSCGGEIDVLLRRQDPNDVWRALSQRDPSQPALLLTAFTPPHAGRQLFIPRNGEAIGSIGTVELDKTAQEKADPLWSRGGAVCLKLESTEVFAELLGSAPHLAIVGASPIAVALCRMATQAGFEVFVVDPRSAFAQNRLFPDARQVVHQWPEEGFHTVDLDAAWYVAVLAHDEKLDVPALTGALRANCRYIGLLGSKTTQEKRRARLQEAGFPEEQIQRIHGPIGFRFGALDPTEIAVSILAELIANRRGFARS